MAERLEVMFAFAAYSRGILLAARSQTKETQKRGDMSYDEVSRNVSGGRQPARKGAKEAKVSCVYQTFKGKELSG